MWKCKSGELVSQSAPVYIMKSFEFIELLLSDPTEFPRRDTNKFSPDALETFSDIAKKVFRVYAHLYHNHFARLEAIGMIDELNSNFLHFIYFVTYHQMLKSRELFPLRDLISNILPPHILALIR